VTKMIEELYYGNIEPCTRYIKKGGEYDRILKKTGEAEDALLTQLSAEQKDLYNRVKNGNMELFGLSEVKIFSEGFRIGARLAFESFEEDDRFL